MANTLTSILPKILARALPVLRQNAITPRLITSAASRSRSASGKTIDIPVSAAQTAAAITNSNTPPSNTDKTPTTVQITLDQHYGTNFHLSDQEVTQINADGLYLPGQIEESVKALANKIDTTVLGLYDDVYEYVGTAGTTPFASEAQFHTDYTKGARVKLNTNLAPMSDRSVVLDPAGEGAALALAMFTSAERVGDRQGILNGEIGTKLGSRWVMNQNIPSHTTGTLSNGSGMLAKVNDASYTVGETTVNIDDTSLTGTVVVGDVFTVAGDTQTYTVTANATASGNAITGMAFTPASKVAWADDAVITFKASHTANLMFHRSAFAIGFAELEGTDFGLANVASIVDPYTGATLRLEVRRDYKQTTWELDCLWGVKTVRPELACRIAG